MPASFSALLVGSSVAAVSSSLRETEFFVDGSRWSCRWPSRAGTAPTAVPAGSPDGSVPPVPPVLSAPEVEAW